MTPHRASEPSFGTPVGLDTRRERLGLLFAASCAVNGAFVPAFAKLTTDRADPLFVAMATTMFAAICAAVVLGARGELALLLRAEIRWRLMAVGALGTAVAYVLFFAGAQRATAIEAALCLQIEPAYSLVAAWLFLGHRPTRRRSAAIAALVLGITLAIGPAGISASTGVWMLLLTPACWQISHLIVLRGLAGVPPPVLTGARYVYGGIFLGLGWIAGGHLSTAPATAVWPSLLPLLAVQGFILHYVGTLLWYSAITRLDLARTTAIVVPSIPLLSLAVSFALLGEVPTAAQIVGMLLTAAGVLAFVSAPHAEGGRG